MKSACIIAASIALQIGAPAQRPQRPVELFNGTDLNGWAGDPALWSVVDGVITGTCQQGGNREPGGEGFLIYEAGVLDDFELTMKVRISGGGRAGVIYRSHVLEPPGSELVGYELGIWPRQDRVGMLQEEGSRGTLALRGTKVHLHPGGRRQILGTVDMSEQVDTGVWNDYSITARGSRLIHKINGKITCSAVDGDADRRSLSGLLALRPPTRAPGKLEVKEIVLQRHNRAHASAPKERDPTTSPDQVVTPQWIWTERAPQPGETAYFRRPWKQDKEVLSASLTIAADDSFTAFLNGEEIGRGATPERASHFDITGGVRLGYNHLAVLANNSDGDSGLVARVTIAHADGSNFYLVTDRRWLAQAAAQEPRGWKTVPASRRNWQPGREIRVLGTEPWGDLFAAQPEDPRSATATPAVPPGFRIDKIYDVPSESQGTWTALTAASDARLFASDQNGSLYQINLGQGSENSSPEVTVEPVDLPIGRANGLLWAFDSLFVCTNGDNISGLFRLEDEDGDGKLDSIATLQRFDGSGEQGPHGIAAGPSPLSIYVACGTQTKLPDQLGRLRPPAIWGADQLLPIPPAGAAPLPGAWIFMTRVSGDERELHGIGLRNPYDIAFNHHGDLFTCDADSPSDRGSPFFRPSAVYHVPKGADFGARGLGRNFPDGFPDSLPPVIELDPGSPTGLTFGIGAAFPRRYQEALFVCDWSRSCIDAVHLTAVGASYTGKREQFLSGSDLHVTDIAIAGDGAMYFTTGGRAGFSTLADQLHRGRDYVPAHTATTAAGRRPHALPARAAGEPAGLQDPAGHPHRLALPARSRSLHPPRCAHRHRTSPSRPMARAIPR